MKLCKDCKHYKAILLQCYRPIPTVRDDLVYGHNYVPSMQYAYVERCTEDFAATRENCGPTGKFWEPTMRYRIINLFKKNDNS
jgi:hypothetical protein